MDIEEIYTLIYCKGGNATRHHILGRYFGYMFSLGVAENLYGSKSMCGNNMSSYGICDYN